MTPTDTVTASTAAGPRRLVLAGNPNAGKSVLFQALSGVYVEVSNYPGTTIEVTHAQVGSDRLEDSPGVYGLGSFNDEERVARDVILKADLLINVVDAVHLERDLFLTLQLLELDKPMVVALNMMDEAAGRDIHIDVAQLQHRLGVPVVPMVAIKRQGVDALQDTLPLARCGFGDPAWRVVLDALGEQVGSRGEALLMLEGDPEIAAGHPELEVEVIRDEMYQTRRRRADALVDACVGQFQYRRQWADRLSSITLHPLLGVLIVLAVLWGLYEFVGVFVAGTVVGFTEGTVMQERYEPAIQSAAARAIAPSTFTMGPRGSLSGAMDELSNSADPALSLAGREVHRAWSKHFANQPWLQRDQWQPGAGLTEISPASRAVLERQGLWGPLNDQGQYFRGIGFDNATASGKAGTMLAGEFGVLTHTVRYVLGLLLPLVFAFYLMLALLEDCGYLPRLATLADRALNAVGLNGRAVIPIILGFGCVTMATITTRLLGTEREKSIATTILNFVIPCSAQLGVIVGILVLAVAAVGGSSGPIIVYCAVIFAVLVLIGTLLDRVLPGKSSQLFIELPPLRLPRIDNVLKKTCTRSLSFMKEAFPWFLAGSVIVAVMQITGMLGAIRDALTPLTVNWLRLTPEAADTFVMGLVRRDFGAAGLTRLAKEGALSAWQMTVSLIVITLFVPCIASMLILLKERGWKQAVAIWTGTWFAAFAIGGLVAQGLRLAGRM